ncbi:MAG: Holliday junction resolvase RuvX [Patescibacteria group bacterium]|jgi:putative Holliday junction resolvase|nr:Holliday junction resolvase RuvX [Patescibacteria group bacterium]
MNILGVDYGTKNIGLAWCDTGIGVVLPFGIVGKQELPDVVKKENIDLVVIGLPIGLNGKENENTKRVKKFAEDLKEKMKAKIDFFDERFTSQQADRMEGGASRDEKSAMLVLESYLEMKKRK